MSDKPYIYSMVSDVSHYEWNFIILYVHMYMYMYVHG